MREIIFDTETTGLRHADGDRVIEIGAVELENRFPTGRSFHVYINPDGRQIHPEALEVHGIGDDFLIDKPRFCEVVHEFLDFIGDGHLVAHNASFDMGFINAEFVLAKLEIFPADRVIDTLAIARRRHPMGPNSLDALCARYNIDNAHRTKHGALLDAELLAEVYIELNGGRQAALLLDTDPGLRAVVAGSAQPERPRQSRPEPLPARIGEKELARHREFVGTLAENAVWNRYA